MITIVTAITMIFRFILLVTRLYKYAIGQNDSLSDRTLVGGRTQGSRQRQIS